MSNQWQDKTRGGKPVENVRSIDLPIWKWEGEIVNPNGTRFLVYWSEDGFCKLDKQPGRDDLIPLEAPPEAPAKPDARKALAEAARAYKRACDATEAAEEAERLAHDALAVAFDAYGVPFVVVNIDGASFLLDRIDTGYAKIEVL